MRRDLVLAFAGAIGGFSLAMLLVGSTAWGDYWICVANWATCR